MRDVRGRRAASEWYPAHGPPGVVGQFGADERTGSDFRLEIPFSEQLLVGGSGRGSRHAVGGRERTGRRNAGPPAEPSGQNALAPLFVDLSMEGRRETTIDEERDRPVDWSTIHKVDLSKEPLPA